MQLGQRLAPSASGQVLDRFRLYLEKTRDAKRQGCHVGGDDKRSWLLRPDGLTRAYPKIPAVTTPAVGTARDDARPAGGVERERVAIGRR